MKPRNRLGMGGLAGWAQDLVESAANCEQQPSREEQPNREPPREKKVTDPPRTRSGTLTTAGRLAGYPRPDPFDEVRPYLGSRADTEEGRQFWARREPFRDRTQIRIPYLALSLPWPSMEAKKRRILLDLRSIPDLSRRQFLSLAVETFNANKIPPPAGARRGWNQKLIRELEAELMEADNGDDSAGPGRPTSVNIVSDAESSEDESQPSRSASLRELEARIVELEKDLASDPSNEEGLAEINDMYEDLDAMYRMDRSSTDDRAIVRAGSKEYEVPGDLVDPSTGEVISIYDPSLTYEQRRRARKTLKGPGSYQNNDGYETRRLERKNRRAAESLLLLNRQAEGGEAPVPTYLPRNRLAEGGEAPAPAFVDRTQRRFWTQGESYTDWIANQKKKWGEQKPWRRLKRKERAIVRAGSETYEVPGDLVDPRTGDITYPYARDAPPAAVSDDNEDAYARAIEVANVVRMEYPRATLADLREFITGRLSDLEVPKPQGRKGWSKAAVSQLMKDAGLSQSRPRRAVQSDAFVIDSSSDDGGESPLSSGQSNEEPSLAGALEMIGDDSIDEDTWLRVAKEIVNFYNFGDPEVHRFQFKTAQDFISQKLPKFYSQIERLDPGKQVLAVNRLSRFYHRWGIAKRMDDH